MPIHTLTCKYCGKVENMDIYDTTRPYVQRMVQNKTCFACLFWDDYIRNPIPGTVVISGRLCRATLHQEYIGHSTKRRKTAKFVFNVHTRQAEWADDLTVLGRVPPHFYDKIPDGYKFVPEQVYERIKRFLAPKCLKKGCFDRYNCFWYDVSIEEENGPWNQLPKDYQPGMEGCESFINKNNMEK